MTKLLEYQIVELTGWTLDTIRSLSYADFHQMVAIMNAHKRHKNAR